MDDSRSKFREFVSPGSSLTPLAMHIGNWSLRVNFAESTFFNCNTIHLY